MINWQEWVVGVLVVLCIARIIYGIFLFFRRTRENKNPCDSCVSGCELKDMLEKKRKECGVKKKSTKKRKLKKCKDFNKEKLLRIVGSFKICTTFATANEKKWFLG